MLTLRTVREQVLPVLKATRERVAAGVPVAEACRMAIHDRSRQTGLSYQTIVDALRRRSGLPNMAALHDLIGAWVGSGSGALEEVLLGGAEAAAHADITRFFAEARGVAEPSTGWAEAPARGPASVALDRLRPAAVEALAARARSNGRSVEAEAAAILEDAVLGSRREFATWAAGLRARLAARYKGEATAEIRADRDR